MSTHNKIIEMMISGRRVFGGPIECFDICPAKVPNRSFLTRPEELNWQRRQIHNDNNAAPLAQPKLRTEPKPLLIRRLSFDCLVRIF
jgi:hypothetical protein